MSVVRTPVIFRAGGECYEKYGVACRRTTPISHGGEELQETFTRADPSTVASIVDRDGYIRRALANVLRVSYELISGVRVPTLLLESSRTNLVTWSDALSNWTSVGTPTVTDAAVTNGGLDLTLLGDDDAAAVEQKTLNVAFTGDGVKTLMCAIKEGTTPPAGGSGIQVRDETAGVFKLECVVTWAAGVPVITLTTGTQLGTAELLRDGIYLVRFQTTSITAANTNAIRVFAADVTGETGNIYIGGVQAEDATFPSSLIKTTGATATRAADRLEFEFYAHPQAMTIYADFIELAQPNWVAAGGASSRILEISKVLETDPRLLVLKAATDIYDIRHITAGGDVGDALGPDLNPVTGDRIELRAVLNTNGSVQLHGAKNGGAESSGSLSSALALAAAWSSPTLVSVGCIGANGQGEIALRSLKIARGSDLTMAEMRLL